MWCQHEQFQGQVSLNGRQENLSLVIHQGKINRMFDTPHLNDCNGPKRAVRSFWDDTCSL